MNSIAQPNMKQQCQAKPSLSAFILKSGGKVWNKPPINVIAGASDLRLEIFAAGIDRENIEVQVEHMRLTVKFKKSIQVAENVCIIRSEYQPNNCEISFTVAQQYDLTAATTRLSNGILHITIPVREKHVSQIEVH